MADKKNYPGSFADKKCEPDPVDIEDVYNGPEPEIFECLYAGPDYFAGTVSESASKPIEKGKGLLGKLGKKQTK